MKKIVGYRFHRGKLMLGRPRTQARGCTGQHLPARNLPIKVFAVHEVVAARRTFLPAELSRRSFHVRPVARIVEAASAIVKDDPLKTVGRRRLAERQIALLGLPLDAFGMNFSRGGKDQKRCLQAVSPLTIQVNPRGDIEDDGEPYEHQTENAEKENRESAGEAHGAGTRRASSKT